MASAGKKRKLGEDVQKWYAVRAGKTPGVYKTWAECQKMTTGFKGASCKSSCCSLHLQIQQLLIWGL